MTFNSEAYMDSRKAILIIFILLTCLINLLHAYKLTKGKNIFNIPKRWLLLTLAGGNALLALFSLIVQVRIAFGASISISILGGGDIPCDQVQVSSIYSSAFLPFVYSISLITLSAELIKRKEIQKLSSTHLVQSVLVAGLPWVSALIFILPLYLAGYDSSLCRYDDGSWTFGRARAGVICSLILPSIFALVMSFVANSNTQDQPDEDYSSSDLAQAPQGIVIAPPPGQQIQGSQFQTQYNQPPPQYGQAMQYQQPTQYNQPPPQYGQEMKLEQTQYGQPPPPAMQYQQPPPPTVVIPAPAVMVPAPPVVAQSSNGQDSRAQLATAKQALVRVALVNFFLTVPFAIFQLAYTLNEDRPDMDVEVAVGLAAFFEFCLYARAFITPVIWYKHIH